MTAISKKLILALVLVMSIVFGTAHLASGDHPEMHYLADGFENSVFGFGIFENDSLTREQVRKVVREDVLTNSNRTDFTVEIEESRVDSIYKASVSVDRGVSEFYISEDGKTLFFNSKQLRFPADRELSFSNHTVAEFVEGHDEGDHNE